MYPVHPVTVVPVVSALRHELEARAAEERLARCADRQGRVRILAMRTGRHRGETRRRFVVA